MLDAKDECPPDREKTIVFAVRKKRQNGTYFVMQRYFLVPWAAKHWMNAYTELGSSHTELGLGYTTLDIVYCEELVSTWRLLQAASNDEVLMGWVASLDGREWKPLSEMLEEDKIAFDAEWALRGMTRIGVWALPK